MTDLEQQQGCAESMRREESARAHAALQADVAAGKRAIEELRQERDFLSAVLDTMGTLAVVLDAQGRIVRFNRACEQTTGYSFDEVKGKELWPLLIASDELAKVRPVFDELLAGQFPNQFENDWLTRDGRRRRIAWSNTAMVGKSGDVEFAIGTGIDITERKIAEEQLLNHREQLRSLALQLSVTEEKERRRIATDLHDGIGQNLALAQLRLGSVPAPGAERPGRQEQARQLIEQALHSVQSRIYELSPPILYDLGLEAALEWLCEHFQDRHGLQVTFIDDQQPKLVAEELRSLLFRAARELLTNVVKHARARTAKLSVCRRGQQLELAVEDDGKGFPTPQPSGSQGAGRDNGGGFGLFSIRERVEHLGGRLEISSLPGSGTRAAVTVPLQVPLGSDRPPQHTWRAI